jgi:prepilin-type N-terminal cleavage/methylation domain-containing protein/prepilin-type processing-associated H-X9-DG protein
MPNDSTGRTATAEAGRRPVVAFPSRLSVLPRPLRTSLHPVAISLYFRAASRNAVKIGLMPHPTQTLRNPGDHALSSGAFTLMELLAALAIMAILVAFLYPAIMSAADRSKSAKCLSNLKQLGTAIMSYTADNNGWMPAPKDNPYSGSGERWVTLVKPYVGEQKGRNSILCCPAEKNQPPDDLAGQWHYLRTDAAVYSGDVPAPRRNLRRPLVTLQKPSQTLILVDGTVWQFPYSTASGLGWTTARVDLQKSEVTESVNLDFHRHKGIMNALYMDGHVSSIPWKDRVVITEAAWRGYGF